MSERDVITSRSDPAVQRIIDVSKSSRPHPRTVLIEDVEPIASAIEAGVEFVEVYALDTVGLPDDLVRACRDRDVPVRLMDAGVLNQIFKGDRKAKVFAIARVPKPVRLRDVEDRAGDMVVLDGVKIVGNMGAIVRTCLALGASALVLVDSDLTSIADRRLIRASRGYCFTLPVVLASRGELVAHLRSSGMSVLAFDSGGDASIHDIGAIERRSALVFGSEKRGPSDVLHDVAREHGRVVSIPMNPRAESLNVSVSVGVGLSARTPHNLPGVQ